MSRASAQAAARLARSENRVATGALEPPPPVMDVHSIFEQAHGACIEGDFDAAFKLLFPVWMADEELPWEQKALPGMLMLSVEGGNTMLHHAAAQGSQGGVTNLLRLGASACQMNAMGQNSAAIAELEGHDDLAALLRRHDAIWSGWGILRVENSKHVAQWQEAVLLPNFTVQSWSSERCD